MKLIHIIIIIISYHVSPCYSTYNTVQSLTRKAAPTMNLDLLHNQGSTMNETLYGMDGMATYRSFPLVFLYFIFAFVFGNLGFITLRYHTLI